MSEPVNRIERDLLLIEQQRLDLERTRAEQEAAEREVRRAATERQMHVRNFLADTIAVFEDIKRHYP